MHAVCFSHHRDNKFILINFSQADLVNWLKDLQNILHKPPSAGMKPEAGGLDLIVTTGSQDGLSKVILIY